MLKDDFIFSNKMEDIYYLPESKVLKVFYKGLVSYKSFEGVIKTINDLSEDKGIYGTLVDVSNLRGSFHRLLGYMEETGFPLLTDNGLFVQAHIISDDLLMENLSVKVGEIMKSLGVKFKIFYDRDEGYTWLKKELKKEK